jgi:hypothetical protein
VVTVGVNPPALPNAVATVVDDVSETSIVVVAAAALPDPAGGAPGVQPASNEMRRSELIRTARSSGAAVRAG